MDKRKEQNAFHPFLEELHYLLGYDSCFCWLCWS